MFTRCSRDGFEPRSSTCPKQKLSQLPKPNTFLGHFALKQIVYFIKILLLPVMVQLSTKKSFKNLNLKVVLDPIVLWLILSRSASCPTMPLGTQIWSTYKCLKRFWDIGRSQFHSTLTCIPSFTDCAKSGFLVLIQFATKKVQWPILNNSHAYPFCKTMPGTQLFSIGHCTWSQIYSTRFQASFATVIQYWPLHHGCESIAQDFKRVLRQLFSTSLSYPALPGMIQNRY